MPAELPDDLQPVATATEAVQQLPKIARERRIHIRAIVRGQALLILAGLAFLMFGLMAFLIRGLAPLSYDLAITRLVQNATLAPVAGNAPVPIYDEALELISVPGFWPYILIISIGILAGLLLLRRYTEAVFTAIAFVGAGVAVEVAKVLVARPRPTLEFARIQHAISGYSFPSGHVVEYVCLFGFLFYLAWSLMKRSWWRMAILLVTGALVALVGVSRIYVGHHWASDTLGGYGLGFGWLCVCIWGYRRWEARHLARLQRLQHQAEGVIMDQSPRESGTPGSSIAS
jgi:undecaprenyl-diphosphatase